MPYSQRSEGLDQLRRELALIPDRILDEAERITGKGMSNILKDARARVRADNPAHLPHLARSYGYDVTRRGQVIRGEAGADMNKPQGKLDVYYTEGTATSPPHPTWSPALDAEVPNFQRYADDLLERLIR